MLKKKVPMWLYKILIPVSGYIGGQIGEVMVNKEWIIYIFTGVTGGTF